jgi:hypothetical protein
VCKYSPVRAEKLLLTHFKLAVSDKLFPKPSLSASSRLILMDADSVIFVSSMVSACTYVESQVSKLATIVVCLQ